MLIYKDIFNFEVLDKLDDGDVVFVADKKMGEIKILNKMKVSELMQILAMSRREETRYAFWIETEEEEEND